MANQTGYPKIVTWLFAWIAILALTSQCSSAARGGVSGDELRRPLNDIRKAIYVTMQGKVKRKSENNRTYFSTFHRPGQDLRLTAYKQPERAQLAITILGDRRPYKVAVVYKIDKLSGGEYRFDRYDKSLARQYLDKVEKYLASRPEERDIIDDFRAY